MECRGNETISTKQFCIVIPIYKEHLDCIERLSLIRLWNIIKDKHYDVYFVRPYRKFDMSEYYDLMPGWNGTVFEQVFDERYFESTATYSELCLNMGFYSAFAEYEYMYICQLDVYLVSDNFEHFCTLGYDYIGAPVLSTDCGWPTIKKINGKKQFVPAVGNGGFSLRKVQTFIDLTDPNGEFRTAYNVTDEVISDIRYEDLYFCVNVYNRYEFEIADIYTAFQFAWDMSVDVIYNDWKKHKLPMAIHAWDKNIRLWENILPELKGNKEVVDYCEEKHKNFFKLYYNKNNSSTR